MIRPVRWWGQRSTSVALTPTSCGKTSITLAGGPARGRHLRFPWVRGRHRSLRATVSPSQFRSVDIERLFPLGQRSPSIAQGYGVSSAVSQCRHRAPGCGDSPTAWRDLGWWWLVWPLFSHSFTENLETHWLWPMGLCRTFCYSSVCGMSMESVGTFKVKNPTLPGDCVPEGRFWWRTH